MSSDSTGIAIGVLYIIQGCVLLAAVVFDVPIAVVIVAAFLVLIGALTINESL